MRKTYRDPFQLKTEINEDQTYKIDISGKKIELSSIDFEPKRDELSVRPDSQNGKIRLEICFNYKLLSNSSQQPASFIEIRGNVSEHESQCFLNGVNYKVSFH